jgi:hypothetical protein
MNTIATKLRAGTAACAVAAAATLVPMSVAGPLPTAHAAPAIPAPEWLGSTLGSVGCLVPIFDAANCAAQTATIGNLFYLGPIDGTPPPRVDILNLNLDPILGLIPVIGPAVSWFIHSLNIEVCVGGLSARIGGYGNIAVSLGSGC